MLLFAAAGFDPRIVPLVLDKLAKTEVDSALQTLLDYFTDEHPSSKRRSQLLSRPEVMEEALEFYRQVRPRVEPKYPKTQEHEKCGEYRVVPHLLHFYWNQKQRNYTK